MRVALAKPAISLGADLQSPRVHRHLQSPPATQDPVETQHRTEPVEVVAAHAELTFLDKEALVRQPQGLLVHMDLDGRLLLLSRGQQPEGLVHEQVFQAVMSEA